MKVLLVDDERFSINALKKTIPWSDLGIDSIIAAEDGLEAWQQYQSHSFDLILTDVNMPNLNGIELVKRIRETDSQVPIIILSGYDEFDYAKEAVHLKVSHYLLKPIVHSEIIPIIRQALEESRVAQKQQQYFKDTQRQLQEAIPVLREQLIFDIMNGKITQGEELWQKISFFQINPEIVYGGLIMSLELHRLNNEKTLYDLDWYLYKYAVSNIAQEVIDQFGGAGYVARYVDDRLPLLLFGREAEEVQVRASAIASKIIGNIASYLEIPSNIGIGRYVQGVNQYFQSHKESKHALLTSTMSGLEKVVLFEDFEIEPFGFEAFSVEEIEVIVQAILKGSKSDVLNAYRSLENRLVRSLDHSLAYLMMVCSGFLIGIILQLVEESEHAVELQTSIRLQDLYNAPSKEALIASMKEKLLRIFDNLDSCQSKHKYIEKIKGYIKANYQTDLTVHDISKHLHLSRTYISKLFKRETGDSITGYLIKYRMQLAKKIMEKEPDLMIYEISSRVGYIDQNYFCRVFKSVTGDRPSDYLLKVRRKQRV